MSPAAASPTYPSAEHERMAWVGRPEEGLSEAGPWYRWGPYLAERAWGTVREDYSANGDAWTSFPHDHARSRAYRWSEDGIAGLSTLHQDICLSLALWNGRDPILKERMFGLTGPEGNHGEDVKEYWWYRDATPSHSWLSMRYHYPQGEFPYADLVTTNAERGRNEPEYELKDTGIFDDDRYWTVDITYSKASPTDLVMRVQVTNNGPDTDRIHLLPHLWFRDTWSWGRHDQTPVVTFDGQDLVAQHWREGEVRLCAAPGPDGISPTPLACENATNNPRLFGTEATTAWPKDGINDHVISGADTVNPDVTGTKAAFWYVFDVPAGQTREIRLRLRHSADTAGLKIPHAEGLDWTGAAFEELLALRLREADDFYATLIPSAIDAERALVVRRAMAGMVWGKQFFRYDVSRWLDGDPGQPVPDRGRAAIRNSRWRHVDAYDVISMPDSWEYPWFATWDLAFHTVVLSHIDPAFAKYQLLMLCREWFMHPGGALPAYEWNFDDVNPPVHAWAALEVYAIDGARDTGFLERIFHKLLMNFAWWVSRADADGDDVFGGGFLGLDNIGPVDRSHLPEGVSLEQTDGTAWMAFYCLAMLRIALELAEHDEVYEDVATKFLEHFVAITDGMTATGMWDPADGFFYDQLVMPDGERVPLRVRTVVGLIPVMAALGLPESRFAATTALGKRFAAFLARRGVHVGDPAELESCGFISRPGGGDQLLLSVVDVPRLQQVLERLTHREGFWSPFGVRSLSKRHLAHPFTIDVGGVPYSIGYEPGESGTAMYGGNSNWRGPVWMPVNHLLVEALDRYARLLAPVTQVPSPDGGTMNLSDLSLELRDNLISLFLPAADGIRPCNRSLGHLADKPGWDEPLFFEFFHGDDGTGLGASHQTGWTGLVADLILRDPRHHTPTMT